MSPSPDALEGTIVRLGPHMLEESDKWPAVKKYLNLVNHYVDGGETALLGLMHPRVGERPGAGVDLVPGELAKHQPRARGGLRGLGRGGVARGDGDRLGGGPRGRGGGGGRRLRKRGGADDESSHGHRRKAGKPQDHYTPLAHGCVRGLVHLSLRSRAS